MATQNALATREMNNSTMTVEQQMGYANAIARAGMLPTQYRNSPADILVAMGLGQSMGLSPTESLYRINVIQGKPTASGELIAAQVRKAGHKLRIEKDEAAQSVTATIYRSDDPDFPFSVTRDRAWAEGMGLASKENYRKQPMTMLTWRAVTAVAREACPEALYGVAYTPDEMQDLPSHPEPRAAQSVAVEPASAPSAAPQQQKAAPVRDPRLQPVRDRLKPFCEAWGMHVAEAVGQIKANWNVADVDALTDAQIPEVCSWLDKRPEPADVAPEPEYEPEEISF